MWGLLAALGPPSLLALSRSQGRRLRHSGVALRAHLLSAAALAAACAACSATLRAFSACPSLRAAALRAAALRFGQALPAASALGSACGAHAPRRPAFARPRPRTLPPRLPLCPQYLTFSLPQKKSFFVMSQKRFFFGAPPNVKYCGDISLANEIGNDQSQKTKLVAFRLRRKYQEKKRRFAIRGFPPSPQKTIRALRAPIHTIKKQNSRL